MLLPKAQPPGLDFFLPHAFPHILISDPPPNRQLAPDERAHECGILSQVMFHPQGHVCPVCGSVSSPHSLWNLTKWKAVREKQQVVLVRG